MTSSSVPSSPCWPRKVRGLTAAADLACPAQAMSLRPLLGLEQPGGPRRARRASAPGLRLWPMEWVAAVPPATCSRASASLQACWPTWWSRTSRCGGARGSASAGFTSSGSPTGGNARALTRPSASEDCWPVLCSPLLPRGPHRGPFPAPLPLFPVLLNSSSQRAQPLGVGARLDSLRCAQGPAGQGSPSCSGSSSWRWGAVRCCGCIHSRLWSGRTWPFCLGSRVYILPTETSIFLGSNPSCHHCVDTASFLTAFFPTVVILVGPGPRLVLEP